MKERSGEAVGLRRLGLPFREGSDGGSAPRLAGANDRGGRAADAVLVEVNTATQLKTTVRHEASKRKAAALEDEAKKAATGQE